MRASKRAWSYDNPVDRRAFYAFELKVINSKKSYTGQPDN